MFALDDTSRIFVLCPSGGVSGGPESLHLLTHALGELGRDARIIYRPDAEAPTPREYAAYDVVVAREAVRAPNNLLIVPEIWAWSAAHLPPGIEMQRAIWWLSGHNFGDHNPAIDFSAGAAAAVRHLVASAYAESIARAQGATAIAPLSSYVNERFFTVETTGERADRVLYNPKKGIGVVERLKAALPDLEWRAVEGLTRDEVALMLARSKVYVDFGHHPGKERLPREAALAGCCVITGRKGSAGFAADVPLPLAYKLDDAEPLDDARVAIMVDTIRRCVVDFATRQADFAAYREHVRGEKARFAADLRRLFARGG